MGGLQILVDFIWMTLFDFCSPNHFDLYFYVMES